MTTLFTNGFAEANTMIHNTLVQRFKLPDPVLLGLLALATLLSCAYQRAARAIGLSS